MIQHTRFAHTAADTDPMAICLLVRRTTMGMAHNYRPHTANYTTVTEITLG